MRKSMAVLALLVMASAAAFADSFVFADTGGVSGATLTITTDGGSQDFAVPYDETLGRYYQGWWSATMPNESGNDNYFSGVTSGFTLNDFFSFNLSGFTGGALSATLTVNPTGEGIYDGSATYYVGDVSTAYSVLDNTDGTSAAIAADLATGNYGSYTFGAEYPSTVVIALNSTAISDINAAAGSWFSVGGTLSPGGAATPEPATFAMLGAGLVALGVAARRRRRV